MEIIRKKGVDGIRIVHNKKLFWAIIALIAILIALVYFGVRSNGKTNGGLFCKADSDCVPATCCHPSECVNVKNKPNCSESICSMVCSGPLDCNAGSCGCVKGKCEIIPNK